MKTVLKEDLSRLTTIPEVNINKLNDKVTWCICDAVERSLYNKENITEINLGYGNLIISLSNNEIRYKFIPSPNLEKYLSETITFEKNPLEINLEDSLADRITKVYKDLF